MDMGHGGEEVKTINLYGTKITLTEERANLLSGGFEKERIESMMKNIKKGDIVFDIGAEQGDITALLGKKTGRIVPFEPSPMMWPHIKANFAANDVIAMDCFVGFVSNITEYCPDNLDYSDQMIYGFPECAYDKMTDTRGFRHLHEEADATKQIKIDDYVDISGIIPDMVTIDVEGSEYHVLYGMEKTIDEHSPLIYVSIHPAFLWENYNIFSTQVIEFLTQKGYEATFLAEDHEIHMVFHKGKIK